MTLQEKGEKTLKKLLALTQDRDIVWSRISDTRFLTRGTNDIVDICYRTEYRGHTFLLYEVKYPCMDADERTYWDNTVRVDMVDDEHCLIWRLPHSRTAWDLHTSVLINSGNVESELDDFLKE